MCIRDRSKSLEIADKTRNANELDTTTVMKLIAIAVNARHFGSRNTLRLTPPETSLSAPGRQ